jgi:hypothetical protein
MQGNHVHPVHSCQSLLEIFAAQEGRAPNKKINYFEYIVIIYLSHKCRTFTFNVTSIEQKSIIMQDVCVLLWDLNNIKFKYMQNVMAVLFLFHQFLKRE